MGRRKAEGELVTDSGTRTGTTDVISRVWTVSYLSPPSRLLCGHGDALMLIGGFPWLKSTSAEVAPGKESIGFCSTHPSGKVMDVSYGHNKSSKII